MGARGPDGAHRPLLWAFRRCAARRQRLPRPGHRPLRGGYEARPQEASDPRYVLRAHRPHMSGERAPARLLTAPLAGAVLRFGAPLALGMGLQTTFNLV